MYLQWYPVHELSFLIFFLIPVIILTYLYVTMVNKIKASAESLTELRKHNFTPSQSSPLSAVNTRNQIIRMLSKNYNIYYLSRSLLRLA